MPTSGSHDRLTALERSGTNPMAQMTQELCK